MSEQNQHLARVSPKPSSGSLDKVTPAAARFLKLGIEKAPNTVRAYRSDLNCYTSWCKDHGVPPFPAAVDQVVNYISELADRYTVATLQRRLAMLSSFHELQGYESPTGSKLVRTAMDGIKRSLGIRQHQAPAFTLEAFRKVILSLDETANGQLRDKVALLLGFTGAFRRGELVALNVGDLHFDEEGILIDVLRSKTDQTGAGQLKAIFYAAHPQLCPVRTVQRYLQRLAEVGPATGATSQTATDPELGGEPMDLDADSGGATSFGTDRLPATFPLLLRMRKGDRFGKERLTD